MFVLGGPMMGRMVDNADAFAKEVVTKTSGGLIILPRGHYLHRNATTPLNFMRRRAASACIQCRSCSELCPRHLLGHPFETHRVMRAFGSNAELTAEAGRLALLCCDCGVCEHVACPMGLSPRRINQAIKNELRAAGMKYEGSRDVNEAYTQWREFRRVPVPRLVNKIGISRYMELPTNDLGALSPAEVRIPLRQHIGAPAQAVVKAGDRVKCGDVIGEIPEQGLGARIHDGSEAGPGKNSLQFAVFADDDGGKLRCKGRAHRAIPAGGGAERPLHAVGIGTGDGHIDIIGRGCQRGLRQQRAQHQHQCQRSRNVPFHVHFHPPLYNKL